MAVAYILFGSNLGNREEYAGKAREFLEKEDNINILRESNWYKSSPVDMDSDEWFLNFVWEVDTDLSPYELLDKLLGIEARIGRKRKDIEGYQPREIDLDIELYNNKIIKDNDKLVIPHPELSNRKFALKSICDLIPEYVHPEIDETLESLLNKGDFPGQQVELWLKNK